MVKKWNSVPNAIAKCKYTESSISVPHFPQVKSSKVTVLQYIFIFFADLGKSCSDVSASKRDALQMLLTDEKERAAAYFRFFGNVLMEFGTFH